MFSSFETNPLGSTSTIPMPMMTSTESLRASGLERNTGIWYLLKHNWRQLTSLVPGLMLLCACGNLHVSWTIWRLYLSFDYETVETHVMLAWFVGAAGGAIFGAFLNMNWSKILIYYSIAAALIPVSTIFVFHDASTDNLLLIGRALAGILYGMILVTLILHIADNSSQFMRRHFMWTISAINLLPTVLLAEFISSVTGFRDVNASIGVIMFALAIFTLIFMPCTYESIVFSLGNGTDLRALEIMLKLRNESRHYIRRDFNEFKMMLAEDYSDAGNIFSNGNSRPLILVLLLRILNVLLTSSCVYWTFIENLWIDINYWFDFQTALDFASIDFKNSTIQNGTDVNVPSLTNETSIVTPNVSTTPADFFVHSAHSFRIPPLQIATFIFCVSLIKLFVGVPFLCLAEKFQVYRNRIIFKVTLCIGVINLIFFIATLVCIEKDDSLIFTFYIAKLLSVIYGLYLLIAFSIDTVGYCELGESFSLTKRYGSIAAIIIGEYLFQAIAIILNNVLIMNIAFRLYFHVVQSAVICFICYLLLKLMPNECLNCTLRSARDKHFVKMATATN